MHEKLCLNIEGYCNLNISVQQSGTQHALKHYLSQVDGKVDLIVLYTSRQRRALPPPFCSVCCIFGSVILVAKFGVAVVAQLSLNHFELGSFIPLTSRPCQTTIKFWSWNIHATSCSRCNRSTLRQVKIRRCQHLSVDAKK